MPLHDAFKTAALGDADGVHEIADGEQRRADDIAGLHFLGEIPEFPDAFDGHAVLFFDVAEHRLGDALFLLIVEPELDGVVTVLAGLGLDLEDAVGAGEDYRDRGQMPRAS